MAVKLKVRNKKAFLLLLLVLAVGIPVTITMSILDIQKPDASSLLALIISLAVISLGYDHKKFKYRKWLIGLQAFMAILFMTEIAYLFAPYNYKVVNVFIAIEFYGTVALMILTGMLITKKANAPEFPKAESSTDDLP